MVPPQFFSWVRAQFLETMNQEGYTVLAGDFVDMANTRYMRCMFAALRTITCK